MKPEEKRIFISDLPETASKDEIETKFQKYGIVKTVEIKERKELGPKNTSLFFSYVNIDIDDSSLQKCMLIAIENHNCNQYFTGFKDFRQNKWHGNFVELQIARESFLDRLKREREAQNKINEEKDKNSDSNLVNLKHNINDSSINTVLKSSKKIRKITEFEQNKEEPPEKIKKINIVCETFESDTNGEKITDAYKDLNIKIVNNKGKSLENGLKIQSFGKPILEINNLKKVKVKPKSESDLKRIESLNRMKKGYNAQKMIIQSALAKIDNKNGKVGNFNETISKQEEKSKKRLFGDESDDEEIGNVFQIKEHFQGKKGQQLLQLQSRYKNDERFKLDSRFLDEHLDEKEEVEDLDTDEEKKKQFEILEQVIGRKVNSTEPEQKGMLRFDPSQPQHAKYELKKSEKLTKNKKKQRKVSESNEIVEPLVSKEVFYKVSDNLKETFQENKPFSLLDTFGETTKEEEYGILSKSYRKYELSVIIQF